MSYEEEFKTVDLIIDSNAATCGVDAFALSLIKAERQVRKLFTHLIFQSPSFTNREIPNLRNTLVDDRKVYFEGFIKGIDTLYSRSVENLIGQEYTQLLEEIRCAIDYRNKIFHGQLTDKNLSRSDLLYKIDSIRKWCKLLADTSNIEFGYDGFARNSFQKSSVIGLNKFSCSITSIVEYKTFIKSNMHR